MHDIKKLLRYRTYEELINYEQEADRLVNISYLAFCIVTMIATITGRYSAMLILLGILFLFVVDKELDSRTGIIYERASREITEKRELDNAN